jgi:hypothetical protein
VLEALAASHASGIMHRDVKPANVLLTNDGRVLLTDFGIAVQESDMTMTTTGMLVGSPEYVAPERARGEATRPASDLFSLGATLYYAAEGRSPFSRESAVGVLTAVLFETPDHVNRAPQLDPLIQGLLAKDPAVRFDAARARQELARLGAEFSGGASGAAWAGTGVLPGGTAGSAGGTPGGGIPVGGTPGGGIPVSGTPGTGFPVAGAGGGTPGGGLPVGGFGGGGGTPGGGFPATGMGGGTTPTYPYPGGFTHQPVPPKKNTGRNVGIGIGAAVAAGAIVAAVVFTSHGGGGSTGGTNGGLLDNKSNTVTSSTSPSSPPSTDPSSPDDSSTSPSVSDSSPSFDPASLDDASTDQTPLTAQALLPASFKDTKGVVYTATNRWTTDCVDSFESSALKTILNKYSCTGQAIGTYTDSQGRILVDLEVMPLSDSQAATNAYQDMKTAKAFTFQDWGIWCPKSGAGSAICEQNQSFGNAQQYGYILPYHRYVLHATSIYVNLSSDPSTQDYLNPAATSGAKAAGPDNYAGNN